MGNFPLLKYRECGMSYLEFSNALVIEKVRQLILNNDSCPEEHKLANLAPLIQCYDQEGEYMLVEFWGDDISVRAYVSWIKEQVNVGDKENSES